MTDGGVLEPGEVDRSDHHKHMDYVQAVITRLANNSFLTKGWALTLASALLGFAVTQRHAGLALAAVVPAIAFWALDTYYLRLERAFREMYRDIAAKRSGSFEIEPRDYIKKQSWCAGLSISLAIFYLTVVVLIVVVASVLAYADAAPAPEHSPVPTSEPVKDSGSSSPPTSGSVRSTQTSVTPASRAPSQSEDISTTAPEPTTQGELVPSQP